MVFDIKTLLLVNFIVNVLSAFTMGVIWYQYHKRFSGLHVILFSIILSVMGIGLILLRSFIPGFFGIVIANTLLIAGLLVLLIGLEQFIGKRGLQIHNFLLLTIYFILVSYFYLIESSLVMREIILVSVTILLDVQICLLLFHRTPKSLLPVVRIVGLVMGCHLFFSIFILFAEIFFPFASTNFFSAGLIGELIVIGYLLLNIWTIIALVMMVTRRLLGEVQAQEEKFTKAFHSSPYAIMLTRVSDGEIFEVNEGFTSITGYEPEEVIGKRTLELFLWEDPKERADMVNRLSQGKITGSEVHLKRKTGETLAGLFSADLIEINNEVCILASISDITDRKQIEDALRQSNRQLNLLTSITRHDILNRIMVILVYCEEVLSVVVDEKAKRQLQAVIKSTEEIQALIEFTGKYQDLGTKAPEWQNIEDLFKARNIQDLLENISFKSEIGDIQIYADKMLNKVMYNLVDNSIRHGKNLTHIHLSAHKKGDYLIICYEDDGGGIAADEKESSFVKGFGKNTGLGLFLIREILSITGLSITETGVPGVGVRFEIRVPAGKFQRPERH